MIIMSITVRMRLYIQLWACGSSSESALSCSGSELSGGVYNIPTGVHLTHHIKRGAYFLTRDEETGENCSSLSLTMGL